MTGSGSHGSRRPLLPPLASRWLVGVLVALLGACGSDPPPITKTPGAPAGGAKGKRAVDAAGKGPAAAAAVEFAIPDKLKQIDWNAKDDLDRDLRDTRDPFQVYADDLRPKAEQAGTAGREGDCTGPLCEEDVAALGLMAIVTGTAVHKAMLIDHRGMGHVVRAGDVVGKSLYRITRITRNEVVFKPLKPAIEGQPTPQELVKRLVSEEELQELLP